MTGTREDTRITRRRALAVTGGTAAAGGPAIAGYQAAFADGTASTATTGGTADAGTANASAASGDGTCVLMSSVTEGPYYLDGALVRKDITGGKSGVPLSLRITVRDTTESCAPVAGAAVEIWHCDAWGYYSGCTTAAPGGSAPAGSEDGSTADDVAGQIFELEPYAKHSGTWTRLDDDTVYDGGGASSGLLTLKPVHRKDPAKGYKGSITLGIDPDAENTGAGGGGGDGGGGDNGGGGGGTPPSGAAPGGAPSAPAPAPVPTQASDSSSSSS